MSPRDDATLARERFTRAQIFVDRYMAVYEAFARVALAGAEQRWRDVATHAVELVDATRELIDAARNLKTSPDPRRDWP